MAGLSHGRPVAAGKPRSLYRHGRRRPTIHEFACPWFDIRLGCPSPPDL